MSVKTKVFTQIGLFFLSKIWPQVKEMIVAFVLELVDFMIKNFKRLVMESNMMKAKSASNKAQEAAEKATKASSKEEAEKYEAIYEVWREVAEMYKQENEELKLKIELLKNDLSSQTIRGINSLEADDVFDLSKEHEIKLRKQTKYLPLK